MLRVTNRGPTYINRFNKHFMRFYAYVQSQIMTRKGNNS